MGDDERNTHQCVLESRSSHDVSRKDVLLEEVPHDGSDGIALGLLVGVLGGEGRRSREGHTHRLGGGSHRVGGVHLNERRVETRLISCDLFDSISTRSLCSNEDEK